jgi:hypothetical protein
MVMTTRDYIRRYANDRNSGDPSLENRTLTFLGFLFQSKTVLFVGYGLEDLEILEYVVQKAKQQSSSGRPQARHFMLQGFFAHQYELMRSMTQYYAQTDIELLPFRRSGRKGYIDSRSENDNSRKQCQLTEIHVINKRSEKPQYRSNRALLEQRTIVLTKVAWRIILGSITMDRRILAVNAGRKPVAWASAWSTPRHRSLSPWQ